MMSHLSVRYESYFEVMRLEFIYVLAHSNVSGYVPQCSGTFWCIFEKVYSRRGIGPPGFVRQGCQPDSRRGMAKYARNAGLSGCLFNELRFNRDSYVQKFLLSGCLFKGIQCIRIEWIAYVRCCLIGHIRMYGTAYGRMYATSNGTMCAHITARAVCLKILH